MLFLDILFAHLDERFTEDETKEWKAFDLSAHRDNDFSFDT